MAPTGRPVSQSDLAGRAVERGAEFLLSLRGHDGLWRDFLTPAGEASLWPSAFIGTALHRAGAAANGLAPVGDALLAAQNLDGGWGYNEDVPSDADSTAWALLFLAGLRRSAGACCLAASCLARHQHLRSGGFATYAETGPIRRFMGVGRWVPFVGWCSAHTEVTAVAGRALAAREPGRRCAQVEAAWKFVRSQQRNDGSWSAYWWTSPHYATLQAAEFALSCGDRDAVARAAQWAIGGEDGDSAESAFATAMSLSILAIADVGGESVERAARRLIALQQRDGGWPSQPIMRIPVPADVDPDGERRWMPVRFSGGLEAADQHRTFTTAACVAALARSRARCGHP